MKNVREFLRPGPDNQTGNTAVCLGILAFVGTHTGDIDEIVKIFGNNAESEPDAAPSVPPDDATTATASGDVRYFISGAFMGGKRFAGAVRGHWAVENSLHWVLDVTFDEDRSRTRKWRMADNPTWPRRFAISLLKCYPPKNSIKGKSRISG